jgi:hypothetical protein
MRIDLALDKLKASQRLYLHLVILLLFTSLPCAQDAGGENPCIGTKDVLRF